MRLALAVAILLGVDVLVRRAAGAEAKGVRIPASAHNLLVEAKTSGNLESFNKGLRGRPDHVVFDLRLGRFVRNSPHHEYGVGYRKDLGVVSEAKPAFWQAEWARAVKANLIVLSGVYPNQPQGRTCWKIELRRGGKWVTHARGTGGWYDRGRYVWGGAGTKAVALEAIRVSVFSPDAGTPIKSIHFRGEAGVSWVVANVSPIDARIVVPGGVVRAGVSARFVGVPLAGKIGSWSWDFGGGATATGPQAAHTFARPGEHTVRVTFSDGKHTASVRATVTVCSPVEGRITPLGEPVMAGKAARFSGRGSVGKVTSWTWDFGDGSKADGPSVKHTYARAGIYKVRLTVSDGTHRDTGLAIVRAHTAKTLHVPQVFLDTDQKNEQDDQHYFGYALFSELDILGVGSVHHGGGQEPTNYAEILHVLDLAGKSGLGADRACFVFHGANRRLAVPAGGKWADTSPVRTEAAEAILAAARGACPANPLWVVPVGPGTNVASAILQARAEGLGLKGRLRVMWLGGSDNAVTGEFNGNNDPWSMYVVARSGLEVWIMPAPVGARVAVDKRTEGHLYAETPLGKYLKRIVPARKKPLYDPSCLSAIISMRLGLGWIKQVERVTVGGPETKYRWTGSDRPGAVRVIRQIDQRAMQLDMFNSMKGKPTRLLGAPPPQAPAKNSFGSKRGGVP